MAVLKGRNHLEDLGVDMIILKLNLNKRGPEGGKWITLAWNRYQRLAFVMMVMNLLVPLQQAICWCHELSTAEGRPYIMEFVICR
jgi:hypothetical protein